VKFSFEKRLGKKEGIPEVYWCGKAGGSDVMAFELLGPNIESLWRSCNKRFSLKCVLMIAYQMVFLRDKFRLIEIVTKIRIFAWLWIYPQ